MKQQQQQQQQLLLLLLQDHTLQLQSQLRGQQDKQQQLLCAVRELCDREQQVLQIGLQQVLDLKKMVQVLTPGNENHPSL
jgi:DNA-directed RNA polymerase specialized sigma subunit